MGEARKSVETFYATLSDAQKTVFARARDNGLAALGEWQKSA